MERVHIKNLYKQFRIGFKKKQSTLARVIRAISGRVPTKKILAVDDVSFTARPGETIGIIGKNGSGKSTLLRLISGIYKKNRGKIMTNGKIISLINLYIGFKLRLTMRDNVYLIGSLFGLTRKDIKERFRNIAEFAELGQYVNTKLSQFSSGMRQRLVFSIGIHADPKILLLDEVFEIGDKDFRNKSSQKIKELVKNGTTVLLVSHELDLIEKYCDRVIWMEEGRIVKSGKSKKVVRAYLRNHKREREK